MLRYQGLDENFKFLILEITKQLEETKKALESGDKKFADKVASRDEYIDNMKAIIAKKSFSLLQSLPTKDKEVINKIMVMNTIASNLEKIGDFLENITKQIKYFADKDYIKSYNYLAYFEQIEKGLSLINTSFFTNNVKAAVEICQKEIKIDEIYLEDFLNIKSKLEDGGFEVSNLLTTLFIFRYFERAGDSLLNIGEAIISSVVGTKIKINQYMAMKDSFDNEDVEFEIAQVGQETRSGCRIDKLIAKPEEDRSYEVIFKEGKIKKLIEEKEMIELWYGMYPGLVPKIMGYEEEGDSASLLLEFLYGRNYQEILLGTDTKVFIDATKKLFETILTIWNDTYKPEPTTAQFMSQLKKRLYDVYKVHPYFAKRPTSIGNIKELTLEEKIKIAEEKEKTLLAPFSVFIHGDMNNDNFIYNQDVDELYFIDLHRSKYSDYCQDISVFLVSNYRVPAFERNTRIRLNKINSQMFDFGNEFALSRGDETFQARLAFGLARSFITSTRFAMRKEFAKSMYVRANYILDKICYYEGDWKDFRLDKNVVAYW